MIILIYHASGVNAIQMIVESIFQDAVCLEETSNAMMLEVEEAYKSIELRSIRDLWHQDFGLEVVLVKLDRMQEIFSQKDFMHALSLVKHGYYDFEKLMLMLIQRSQSIKNQLRIFVTHQLSSDLVQTIKMYAKSNMNISACAKDIYVHRNTLIYRLDQIKNLIGINPKTFDGLSVLYLCLEE